MRVPDEPSAAAATRQASPRRHPQSGAAARKEADRAHVRSLRDGGRDRRLRWPRRRLPQVPANQGHVLRRRPLDVLARRARPATHERSAVRGRHARLGASQHAPARRHRARPRDPVAQPCLWVDARRVGEAQCARPHAAAISAIPERPRLFRFPFGACNAASCRRSPMRACSPSSGTSRRAILRPASRRGHCGCDRTRRAAGLDRHHARERPRLSHRAGPALAIPALRAKGFEFATVSELIAAGEPVVSQTCYDSHPGDTDRYDFLFRKPTVSSSWEPRVTHVRSAPTVSP